MGDQTGPLMPPEWAPQDRVWMAFPAPGYSLGESYADAEEARTAWASVANTAVRFEPVTVVVDPGEVKAARAFLDPAVEILPAPLNDAWMRDIGPTFVHAPDGSVAAVDWVFNGWGGASWASWDKDQEIARTVAAAAQSPLITSLMVNEGGGIHVDGAGTVLVTETVQRGQGRNEHWTMAEVELELARTIGATEVVWLPRGLTRDYETYGTRGHVDIVATFVAPGRVLLHHQRDSSHPDYEVSRELKAILAERFDVIDLPAPAQLRDSEGWVDWSYVNHLVLNNGVIACSFDDPHDGEAVSILEQAYPGREVVSLDARAIFARGGGIHCITQQQPSPR